MKSDAKSGGKPKLTPQNSTDSKTAVAGQEQGVSFVQRPLRRQVVGVALNTKSRHQIGFRQSQLQTALNTTARAIFRSQEWVVLTMALPQEKQTTSWQHQLPRQSRVIQMSEHTKLHLRETISFQLSENTTYFMC